MITKFRYQFNKFIIEFDRYYGCDHRTGWSIFINGCLVIEFEKSLFIAILKYIKLRLNNLVNKNEY